MFVDVFLCGYVHMGKCSEAGCQTHWGGVTGNYELPDT